ncbi:hypothetical protein [Paraburkholderia sp. J8-2]|uniref:hypothetical protein n=1 Tax=Paraburkholderia sp. J8-2 TaxID=2805440 RepID=UPI002AB71FD7|nr:hypothetical protein [Paraburkholderia sp. J8-2]
MFSGLSKLADKPFVMGFFLPSLLGLMAFIFANRDLPLLCRWLEAAEEGEKGFGDVVVALFVIWAVAVFLMALNDLTYRLLEGYVGPFNNRFCIQWQVRRSRKLRKPFNDARRQLDRTDIKIRRLRKLTDGGPPRRRLANALQECYYRREKLRVECNDLLEKSNRHYYDYENEEFILGTSFGNVIRCFEMYPHQMYNVSSVVMWPRLVDVISKDYKEVLSDARASVDMFLSLYVVSLVIAATAIGRGIARFVGNHYTWDPSLTQFTITIAIAFAASWAFYLLATQSALTWWGETYRSAYDLYLGALTKKLGFLLPDTEENQRRFWQLWSRQFRYYYPQDFSDFQRATTASRTKSEGGDTEGSDKEGGEKENDDGDDDEEETDDEDEGGPG